MASRTLTFGNNDTPLDLLLFATFGREVVGLTEATFAANPGLAELGVFPPAGTKITVAVPAPITAPPAPIVRLY